MEFKLKITLDPNGVSSYGEVAAAITRSLPVESSNAKLSIGESLSIRDAEGNKIGSWSVVADADDLGANLSDKVNQGVGFLKNAAGKFQSKF